MELAAAVWPDVPRGATVVLPLGSTEQHGPHLPLDTDTVIATAVARDLAPLVGGCLGPPVPYGASGEHQHFPGTVSVGTTVLTLTVVELVRSLATWAGAVVLVNGHGGNVAGVTAAVDQLTREGHDVAWVPCSPGGEDDADAHAGRTETSLMLHLAPQRVRPERAAPGNTTPLRRLLPLLREGGVVAASPNGVLGDPTGASAAEGRDLLQAMVSAAYHRLSTRVRLP